MTITQSLRDDNAASGSITDAIDKLAIAMGGGFRSVSTRQNTDATGRIVQQTLFTEEGTAVSVKRSERNTGGGTKEGTGGTAIQYDGLYWTMNGSYGAHSLEFVFEADDDEKIVIRLTANGKEATAGDDIRILNATLGGETSISISSLTDEYTFLGFPGQSYKVIFEAGGGGGNSNGTMTVDYMPELVQAINDPFTIASQIIPSEFYEAIPKLLPTASVLVTGGPAVFSTRLRFMFPQGLRPWFGGSTIAHQALLVVKFIGGVSLPWAGVTSSSISVLRWEAGFSYGVAISDSEVRQTSSGFWPAFVGYFAFDDEVFGYTPVSIDMTISHGSGTVIPSGSLTLGYFVVRGSD